CDVGHVVCAPCLKKLKNPGNTDTTSYQFLFLLNLARRPDGAAISVVCIKSQAAATDGQGPLLKKLRCEINYSRYGSHVGAQFVRHNQSTQFRVPCTDFSNGLPNPDGWFQFVVPNFALGANAIEMNFHLTQLYSSSQDQHV
ncbi:hypothetical protein EJB05_33676, partial [Eragrostis curvula]